MNEHADHGQAPQVHTGMIYASENRSDIERAKRWYLSHRLECSSFLVLNALLDKTRKAKQGADVFAVIHAKQLIQSRPLNQSPPALIGTLLRACPDKETIKWAKQTYRRTKLDWILIDLLLTTEDAKLIETAELRMPKLGGSLLESKMLFALLKKNPNNSSTRKRTRIWLRQNPRDPFAKKLRAQLKVAAGLSD